MSIWKYCTTEHCVAFLLSLNLITLDMSDRKKIQCLYALSRHPGRHYQTFIIPKRNGGRRTILAPDPLMKHVQRNLLKHVLAGIPVSAYATAYHRGADIVKNALPHVGQKKVLKLDLEDFFGSITSAMVYKHVFSPLVFPPAVRTLLVTLCCYEGSIPQGASTSAAISNIVMRPFDEHMGQWCAERTIQYTRYCDDMTFSGDFDEKQVKNKAENFLRVLGFTLNPDKTTLLKAHQRQTVTGVVVNQKPQTDRDYRKKVRQEVYYCRKFGAQSHFERLGYKESELIGCLHSLLGKINHILHISPQDEEFRQAKALVYGWIDEAYAGKQEKNE